MYVPKYKAIDDLATIRAMVASIGAASFITTGDDAYPQATLLPIVWEGDRVVAHMARGNNHWRHVRMGSPCLLVVAGVDTYVSPNWYPAKAAHGRVVPTWNYEAVHMRGTVTIHDDPPWLLAAVTTLTDMHEARQPDPWHVTDAPDAYIAGQLRGIVGIEINVADVQAKSKMSQNRSDADRAGVIAGLRRSDQPRDSAVATAMHRRCPLSDVPSRACVVPVEGMGAALDR